MWKLPSPLVCFQLLTTSQKHHLDLVLWHRRSSLVTQFYWPDVKRSRDCCLQCYVIWPQVEKKDVHSMFLSNGYVLKWGAVELSTTAVVFRDTEGASGGHRTPYDSAIILNRSSSSLSPRRNDLREIPYWGLSRREISLSLCLQCRWLNAVIVALLFRLKLAFTFPVSRWLLQDRDAKLKVTILIFVISLVRI